MKTPRTALFLVVLAAFLFTVIYGLVRFPYAPYRMHGESYTDKTGQTHTVEEFLAYHQWERVMFVTGTAWALLGIGSALERYLRTGSFRVDVAPGRSTISPPVV